MPSWPVDLPHLLWGSLVPLSAGDLNKLHSSSWTLGSWLWPMFVSVRQLCCKLRWVEGKDLPLNLVAAVPCNWSQPLGSWGIGHAMHVQHLLLRRSFQCPAHHSNKDNWLDLAFLKSSSSWTHQGRHIPFASLQEDKNPLLRHLDRATLLLVLLSMPPARWPHMPGHVFEFSLVSQALRPAAFSLHADGLMGFRRSWQGWQGHTGSTAVFWAKKHGRVHAWAMTCLSTPYRTPHYGNIKDVHLKVDKACCTFPIGVVLWAPRFKVIFSA